MSTTTQESLIESILGGDDAALNALSDQYEEEGDPARAELVRLQAKRVAWPFRLWESYPHHEREQQLLSQHQERWVADLPRLLGIEFEFWRGVPRAVAEDGHALRHGLDQLAM